MRREMRYGVAVAMLLVVAEGAWCAVEREKVVEQIERAFGAGAKQEWHLSNDSGTLGWGESQVLDLCVTMYEATGETKWLDRLVEHVDGMFSTMSVGPLGLMGWRTTRYSVAFARVAAAAGNRGQAKVVASPEDIWAVDEVAKVTGRAYRVGFPSKGRVVVHDLKTQAALAAEELKPGAAIRCIPGVALKVEGDAEAGDWFTVQTTAPKALDYVVHDGMVLTPVARFVALARSDARLESYRAAADRLLAIMEKQLVHKWDGQWKEIGEGRGAYLAPDDRAQRFGGCTLPHNQYAALGRTFVYLWKATKNPWYRARAQAMALNFKHHLQVVDDHYVWNYWDEAGPWDEAGKRMQHTEDTSHGNIEVELAVDCFEAGFAFDAQDMKRFARTLMVMWNGSREAPAFAGRVGKKEGPFEFKTPWVRVARFDGELSALLEAAVGRQEASSLNAAVEAAWWLAGQCKCANGD